MFKTGDVLSSLVLIVTNVTHRVIFNLLNVTHCSTKEQSLSTDERGAVNRK